MQQLTAEDKARVFGMYLGAPVKYKRDAPVKMLGIESNSRENLVYVPGGYAFAIDNCQLILRNISKISDEDKSEVCRIAGFDGLYEEGTLNINPMYGNYTQTIDLDDMVIIDHSYNCDYETEVKLPNVLQIIDFLRSRSYALPYKGIDLFEAGIAIEQP